MKQRKDSNYCIGGNMKQNQIIFQVNTEEGQDAFHTYQKPVANFYINSIWLNSDQMPQKREMREEHLPEKISVAVIGGGMAGMLTAYQLKQRGVEAIVLEQNQLGGASTSHTTAKITSLHGGYYSKIMKAHGYDVARNYYLLGQESIAEYEKLANELKIECDFEYHPHVLYSKNAKEKIEEEYECLRNLQIPVKFQTESELPFEIAGSVILQDQAQFHPLKFLYGLSNEIDVYPNCKVTQIDSDGTITVNHNQKIITDTIVIATHYPIINSKGFYFTKLHQNRSYVVALKQPKPFEIQNMYIELEEKGHSFRRYRENLFMGVGDHRTGQKENPDYYQQLREEAKRLFPDATIEYQWSNQDCMSLDYLPYIGRYSKHLENVYVATGFNEWGMSNSMVAANILADLIAKKQSDYQKMFSVARHSHGTFGNLMTNGIISAGGLLKQLLKVKQTELSKIGLGEAGIIKYDGKTIGVYKDEAGEIHAIDTKCPHLGCQLQWNASDKTWDCPCHGSSFDMDGNLLLDPAEKNLEKVKKVK